MWTDIALVAVWLAALVFACWHCWTSDQRHDRATRRRLLKELERLNHPTEKRDTEP